MPLSEAAILVYEQKVANFQNAPNPNFDLYVISFICSNFDAFTTFSAIFTRIHHTSNISNRFWEIFFILGVGYVL